MPAKLDLIQVEKDKLAINPDVDFREIATRKLEDISPNLLAMFKWSGVYMQLQRGFFMIRLRVPGGILTSAQVARAGDLADQYGQGQLCITTRQCLQFHWIRQQDIHKIIEGMAEVGILCKNACGDVTRNVVSCPLQGVCPHEVGESVRKVLMDIADSPNLLDEQRNLPRKHKISVNGCGRACGQTLMNCQSWHPVRRVNRAGVTEVGWTYYAGGGLGARPVLAKLIYSYVPEELVLPVTEAATEVFRVHGNRRVRAFARLKFVVEKFGVAGFAEQVEQVLRARGVAGLTRLERATGPANLGESFLDGQSVIPQRQPGLNAVRVVIPRSEFTGAEARRFAAWAAQYGYGEIMFTNRQNLQIRYVPTAKVPELVAELKAAGYDLESHERLPDTVACVGTTQCNLAVADTPNTYRAIVDGLGADKAWWQSLGHLRINLNGCPNSCGQHAIADIGLRGTRKRDEAGSEEGYSIYVGGSFAGAGHLGEYVADVVSTDVVPALRRILNHYLHNRQPGEIFTNYARRIGGAAFRPVLAATPPGATPINLRNLSLGDVFNDVIADARHHAEEEA